MIIFPSCLEKNSFATPAMLVEKEKGAAVYQHVDFIKTMIV